MIGDDIVSDVGGAQACGIRGVQVRTGKYRCVHAFVLLGFAAELWFLFIYFYIFQIYLLISGIMITYDSRRHAHYTRLAALKSLLLVLSYYRHICVGLNAADKQFKSIVAIHML